MPPTRPNAEEQPPAPQNDAAILCRLSPREIALLIRSLDSRLASIHYEQDTLVYSFDVGGRVQAFRMPVAETIESIVDLYPEAEAREGELVREHGLVFQRPKNLKGGD